MRNEETWTKYTPLTLLTLTLLFNFFVPVAKQTGQAALLGRLSITVLCGSESTKEGPLSYILYSWSPPFASVSTVFRGHPSLVSLFQTLIPIKMRAKP
jgi:hypothetical protein